MRSLAIICGVAALVMSFLSLINAVSSIGSLIQMSQLGGGSGLAVFGFYIVIDGIATAFYLMLAIFLFLLSKRFKAEGQ